LAVNKLGSERKIKNTHNINTKRNTRQKAKKNRKKLPYEEKYVSQKFECKKIFFIFEVNM
jgi:hypothetical protein